MRFAARHDTSWIEHAVPRATGFGATSRVSTTQPAIASADLTEYPDTAIVSAVEVASVEAARSQFNMTARFTTRVLQGSWYPLYRVSNGYNAYLRIIGASGPPIGTRTSCVLDNLWDVPLAQCMIDLSHSDIYGYSIDASTIVSVGSECGYNGEMDGMGTVAFYHNFDRDLSKRQRRQTVATSRAFSDIVRKCLPSPEQLCDEPSYCSPTEDGSGSTESGGGWDATVDGRVEFEYPLVESGGIKDVLVCDVTDWYTWSGYDWSYSGTSFDGCWWEYR